MTNDGITPTGEDATVSRLKPYNDELRAQLAAYRELHELTIGDLSRELSIGEASVSRYLNGKPEGDVARLEARIEDVLKAAPERRAAATGLFETPVSQRLNAACQTIRKTNDVGLIHGPAGLGKTCAIKLYLVANPSALAITCTRWSNSGAGLERTLADQFVRRRRRGTRADWIVDRLKDSNRLLLIDNAHRLSGSGRQWIFDFHDDTGIPIALVGNPEVLDAIRENDQQFSRIGLLRPLKPELASTAAITAMLQLHCPAHARLLQGLAEQVVRERGHFRALKKHLLLLPELMGAAHGDVKKAFLMAHTQLVNDYALREREAA